MGAFSELISTCPFENHRKRGPRVSGVYGSTTHSKTHPWVGCLLGLGFSMGGMLEETWACPEAQLPAYREAGVGLPWQRGESPDHGRGRAPASTSPQAK